MGGGRRRLSALALAAAPVAFLGWFFAWPLVAIVERGLRPAGQWDLGAVGDVLGDPAVRHTIWFTAWQAALSTALTLAVGLPGAYVLARVAFRGRSVVRALVLVPFVLPTVVVAAAFLALAGPRGVVPLIGLDGSLAAVLVAHVFFNYAVVARTVGALWAHLDPALEEAARTLGAGRWRALRAVTWPRLRPAVASATAITYLFTFTSFGVVRLLGGPAQRTIEVAIQRAVQDQLDLRAATVLALVQLVAVAALLVVVGRVGDRVVLGQHLVATEVASRPARTRGERAFLVANLAVMGTLLGVPLLVLVERSLRGPGGYGLQWYRALGRGGGPLAGVHPFDALRGSLAFAVTATAIAVVLGTSAALVLSRPGRARRAFALLLMLPLGTSAVTVGFGFLVGLDRPIDVRSSWWLVPSAHALVAIPFVVRTLVPVLRSIDERLHEAAAVLGASPARRSRAVDLPILRRPLLVAAGFAFAVSLGEFGATVLIARPQRPTLPVAIFRLLGRPGAGAFGVAMALSVVLMALTAVAILAIERLRPSASGAL